MAATVGVGVSRRRLMVRDGLMFLGLAFVSVALGGVTLVLFRSFEVYRGRLGREYAEAGRAALRTGRPGNAVAALRTALTFAPDDRGDQILLAEALAGEGRTEEAGNYFRALWETRPGDGLVNLELARVAKREGRVQEATDFYRAALFGSWGEDGDGDAAGDASGRRREVRLELADYLIAQHDLAAARAELLIAADNAPGDAAVNVALGDRLAAAGDAADALVCYRKAVADDPHNLWALERAGRAAYGAGDYETAHRMLQRALGRMAAERRAGGGGVGGPGSGSGLGEGEILMLDADAYRLMEMKKDAGTGRRRGDGR